MSYNSVGLACNPDPPAEPIEREYNDAALLFQNDEQVLERIERLERRIMKPILFSTPMVQAILDGRKTQTRRVVKINGFPITSPKESLELTKEGLIYHSFCSMSGYYKLLYQPGDILWVRETWCKWWLPHGEWMYRYKATDPDGNTVPTGPEYDDDWVVIPWHPSIHMPREAARLFLRVTDVRVERLQDITHEDVLAEGIPECAGRKDEEDCNCADSQFIEIWESIYAKRGYGWDKNPWVWVYTFERETEKGAV